MSTKLRGILFAVLGLVLVGLGIAAVAVILFLRQSLSSPQSAALISPTATAVQVVKSWVVVAIHDKKAGDLLKAEDLDLVEMPVDLVPRDALMVVEDAVGTFIRSDLVQGELVLQHNLADPTNNNSDLSFILSDDHVLMAFPADDLMSTVSVLQRGDIVDILATLTEQVREQGVQPGQTGQVNQPTQVPIFKLFTFDAIQRVGITAMVMDIIVREPVQDVNQPPGTLVAPTPSRRDMITRAYMLALNPQDALVLKHLKDIGAVFDIVLRSPTSTTQFNLTPVSEEYIVELYGLEILP